MPQFFIVLFKINLALFLFGAAYFLVLRRLTFYRLNRAYLAFGILFSSVYPFLELDNFFLRHPAMQQQIRSIVPELQKPLLNWSWIYIAFFSGVFFFLLRLCLQYFSLHQLHKKSSPGWVGNFKVRLLADTISPFSFWQSVYVNPSLHGDEELKNILEHERIHVKDWHSLDILLAELTVVFYWFNPGVWMIKKAVKENLEFITDEKVLRLGIDRKGYQYSLLEVGKLKPAAMMVNNFTISDLKRRIQMMNQRRSSAFNLGRYILLVPVLATVTLAFTVSGFQKKVAEMKLPATNVVETINVNSLLKPLAPVRATMLKGNSSKSRKFSFPLAKKRAERTDEYQASQMVMGIKIDPINVAFDPVIEAGPEVPKAALREITVIGRSTKSSSVGQAIPANDNIVRVVVGRKMTAEEIAKAKEKRSEEIKP